MISIGCIDAGGGSGGAATGGASNSGGAVATPGGSSWTTVQQAGSGGVAGQPTAGGSLSAGGTVLMGGSPTTGRGGAPGAGGSTSAGGSPNGGNASGGVPSKGGATSSGGSSLGGSAAGGNQTATGGGLAVSFDPTKQPPESKPGTPYSPFPDGVVVTKVTHFDVSCWKIAAAGGTLYFESGETAGKSGFDSAFDQAGNDWIGNDADKGHNTSPKGTGKHEYRGWPNFGNGDFDHPQRSSGTKTRWVDATGKEVPFVGGVLTGNHLIMRSANSTYELEYHFFKSHAAIKVIKAADKYAFLYEGPIGGEQEGTDKDKWVTKDGKENGMLCSNTACSSPFIYFVDSNPKDAQVWYIGAKDTTPGMGGDSYVQASNMVVVSYGRFGSYPNDKRALSGTDAVSVFGFHSKAAGHAVISSFIDARLAAPFTEAPIAGVLP